MKISCLKEHIDRAIAIAERFTGKNVTLPILGNILLETQGNSLSVVATNLEYAVEIKIPGKGVKDGRVSVPARIFSSLIQSIKEDKLDLEEKHNNLLVKTESRETRINGMPTEDFPLVPKIKKVNTFSVDTELFQKSIESVLPAVSTSEFKPELTGIFFHVSSGGLRLAATDTFRLAEKTIELSGKHEGAAFSFILPQRVAQELSRILQEKEGDVRVSIGENQIFFELDGVRVLSRLIEGVFPEYGGIVPKNFATSSFVSKNDLMQAIRSSSIFASKIQDVGVSLTSKAIEIRSQNQDIGEQRMSIPASITGDDIQISFNFRYLLDGLQVLDDEEIFFGCNKEQMPSLLRNKRDGTFFYVLMPIRLA